MTVPAVPTEIVPTEIVPPVDVPRTTGWTTEIRATAPTLIRQWERRPAVV